MGSLLRKDARGHLSLSPSLLRFTLKLRSMASNDETGWFQREVKSINPDAQRLLENYSGLAPAEVLPHVLSLVRGCLVLS